MTDPQVLLALSTVLENQTEYKSLKEDSRLSKSLHCHLPKGVDCQTKVRRAYHCPQSSIKAELILLHKKASTRDQVYASGEPFCNVMAPPPFALSSTVLRYIEWKCCECQREATALATFVHPIGKTRNDRIIRREKLREHTIELKDVSNCWDWWETLRCRFWALLTFWENESNLGKYTEIPINKDDTHVLHLLLAMGFNVVNWMSKSLWGRELFMSFDENKLHNDLIIPRISKLFVSESKILRCSNISMYNYYDQKEQKKLVKKLPDHFCSRDYHFDSGVTQSGPVIKVGVRDMYWCRQFSDRDAAADPPFSCMITNLNNKIYRITTFTEEGFSFKFFFDKVAYEIPTSNPYIQRDTHGRIIHGDGRAANWKKYYDLVEMKIKSYWGR